MNYNKGLLECIECKERYSLQQVAEREYCIETFTCLKCYAQMQRLPQSVSCFGKPTRVFALRGFSKILGYNKEARECKQVCPDRVICSQIFTEG